MNRGIITISSYLMVMYFLLPTHSINSCQNDVESLANPKTKALLKKHFFLEADFFVEPSSMEICADGKKYVVLQYLGSGEEGEIYQASDLIGKKFALKIYNTSYRVRQNGDVLALKKAKKSREYLNVPILVNTNVGYSIFPFLISTINRNNPEKDKIMLEFDKALDLALIEDGLTLGDNGNPDNYMYDDKKRLWRIDFGSLKERDK